MVRGCPVTNKHVHRRKNSPSEDRRAVFFHQLRSGTLTVFQEQVRRVLPTARAVPEYVHPSNGLC